MRNRNYKKRRAAAPTSGHSTQDSALEVVFGRHPVEEVLKAGKRKIFKLWVAHGAQGLDVKEMIRRARDLKIDIQWSTTQELDRLAPGHHQGVAAQVSAAEPMGLEEFLDRLERDEKTLVVLLDEIQDPQNIGTILRAAGFFGVTAAIVAKWRTAPIGATAFRASSGAAEHVRIIRVTNLVQSIDRLKDAGFEVVGTSLEGEPAWTYTPTDRCALVLGNEGNGIRRLVAEHCTRLLGIPAQQAVESLNVGSAAAIFLYELSRPRTL